MSRDPYEGLRHALAIIPLIQSHQGITLPELAARTGLTEAQISDEVAGLVMMCGVPPYAPNNYVSFWIESGRVYVRFADQFERPVRLVLQEALALVMALRPLEARQHPFRDAARSLREKILAAIGPEASLELDKAERVFHVAAPGAPPQVARLRDAMARCQKLRIVYWSAHRAATSERVIQPYGMVAHQGEWYVVAHDSRRDETVTFRVDRIRDATLLDDEFEVPDDFDIQQWHRDSDFVPKPGKTVARVLVSAEKARYVREDLPRKDVTDLEDGRVLAKVRVGSEAWFLSWLLHFGGGVEVLEPAALREKVRATCRELLDFYAEPLPEPPA